MPAHVFLFYGLMLGTTILAFTLGGGPERKVAAMLVAATVASPSRRISIFPACTV